MSRRTISITLLMGVFAGYACSDDPPTGAPADSGAPGTDTDGAPSPTADASPNPDSSTTDGGATGTDAATDGGVDSGPQWVGPDGGVTTAMNYFVTSKGNGKGGDFRANPADTDGLAGADAFCKSLAAAVSPILGAKTWRAYLGTAAVSPRSRIAAGPYYNAKGVVIASSAANLHDEGAMNLLTQATNLDELGNPVSIAGPNVHDILTGANVDGTASANHCADWTSSATTSAGQVGHSNRNGGGATPTSWNSAHPTQGCAESGANSVRSGGGRGSIYCFAN